ncbi:MAG: hypothetical protein V4539_09830 [Bacteroidota bacterium]
MAENIDEEPIDSLANTQSGNPLDEISPTKDTDIINQNQEPENMEVHHHPDIHHNPKKWKEYFLEFLMIFLAVTLGFFAENIREHLSEKKKAHSLAESFETDLKKDTSQLNFLINFNRGKVSTLDSLFDMTSTPFDQINQQYFYRCIQKAIHTKLFSPNNASCEEIKRSGYFHYYNTDSLADLISQYDFLKTDFTSESQLEMKIDQDEWVDVAADVTDPAILNKTLRPYHSLSIPYKIGITPVPVEKFNRFKGHVTKMRSWAEYDVDVFLRMKAKATSIMECMKKNKIISE